MKRLLLALMPLLTISLIACAQSRKTTATKQAQTDEAITSLSMRRTPCFGRCPTYEVTIKSNGMVTYSGDRNVANVGVYEKNIGAAAANNVLKRFMEYRIDTCAASYRVMIADIPGINYKFTIGGKERQIANAHFGPEFLQRLSSTVDEVSKVDDSWKKIGEKAPD